MHRNIALLQSNFGGSILGVKFAVYTSMNKVISFEFVYYRRKVLRIRSDFEVVGLNEFLIYKFTHEMCK